MRFQVEHRTAYSYGAPVRLGLQRVRLRPRGDRVAALTFWELAVEPPPAGRMEALDAEGNRETLLWFDGPTERFHLYSRFTLHTEPTLTGNFFPVTPGWEALKDPALQPRLLPYLACREGERDQTVTALSSQLRQRTGGPLDFLFALNGHLHRSLEREIRREGGPLPPVETLRRGRGACRDLAVLFAAVCRVEGLAVRFVSGYQARSEHGDGERYMHAWPEVYLPGVGWRGFDPTHGTEVSDAHVAVAAAADPDGATPVSGSYFGATGSSLTAEVRISAEA